MSNWISLPLSDLSIASGKSINPFEFPDEEFELYSVPSHETGKPEFVKGGDIGSNKQLVSPGTVLLCKINPRINRTWIVGEAGSRRQIASMEWIAFDSCEEVDQRFLMFFMQQSDIRDYLAANASGVGGSLMRIKPATLKGVTFRMPGIQTQRKIVEKLEELLSDLDVGVAELRAAQRKLAQYRQSLLKAAVEGALTADWRAAHGQAQEAGAELLQRILSERRARWEQKQLVKFAEQGKRPPKDWQAKYSEPVAPDLTDLPLLPEGWVWARVEQLAELVSGHTPKDAGQFANDDGAIQWFKVGDMNAPGNEVALVTASVKFTRDVAGELGLKVAPAGTIVFPKRGGAIATNKKRRLGVSAAYDLNMMGLVAAPSAAEWLWSWFRGVDLAKLSDGSNIPQINNPDIAPLHVPIPPAAEQEEIIERLERALDSVTQQEDAVVQGLKQVAAQRKNLLKAAFAGQLIPQDPNEEPASELLARIRAARATNDGDAPRRRRKSA